MDDRCKCGKESTYGGHGIRNGEVYDIYTCDDCHSKYKPVEPKINKETKTKPEPKKPKLSKEKPKSTTEKIKVNPLF